MEGTLRSPYGFAMAVVAFKAFASALGFSSLISLISLVGLLDYFAALKVLPSCADCPLFRYWKNYSVSYASW